MSVTQELFDLVAVALVAALAPLVVAALPGPRVPQVVIFPLGGILIGPHVLGLANATARPGAAPAETGSRAAWSSSARTSCGAVPSPRSPCWRPDTHWTSPGYRLRQPVVGRPHASGGDSRHARPRLVRGLALLDLPVPLGILFAGALAGPFGVRQTILLGAGLSVLSCLVVLVSGVWDPDQPGYRPVDPVPP
ncbi:MAG TPA: hypothetical protein VK817_02075 [Trebonia sp.]|nr:hypothetical protein [Trebonia sp.]